MTTNPLNFILSQVIFNLDFSLICILGPRKVWRPPKKSTKRSQKKTRKMYALEDEPASPCEYILIFKNNSNSFKENVIFRTLCPAQCSKKYPVFSNCIAIEFI